MPKVAKSGSTAAAVRSIATAGIEGVESAQLRALDKAPSMHVGIIQIALFCAIISVLLGGLLIYNKQSVWGSVAILAGIAVLAWAMYLIRPLEIKAELDSAASTTSAAAPASGRITWSRVTIKYPIPPLQLNELSEGLRVVRKLAQVEYQTLLRNGRALTFAVDASRVRVNVFIPDTQDIQSGEVCGLFIPERLHDGMVEPDERSIWFRPNEGLTGRVFATEQACGAVFDPSAGSWRLVHLEGAGELGDEEFEFTLRQASKIAKALRWIVAFPLKMTLAGATYTFAVLNVDGLDEPVIPADMRIMHHALKGEVARFSQELAKLDKLRLTIVSEDLQAS